MEARQKKEEEENRKKDEAPQQKEEARQQKEEQEEQARHEALQQKKEREEEARQQKEEQEEQAPKARGKYKTFDNQMEDLKQYKEMHGHANVTIPEDKSLGQFCAKARHARKNPGNGKQLTNERIAAFNVIGFNWTSQDYVTRSFDERINNLEEYKKHDDNSLYQFCADVRHSLKIVEKDGTRKLTKERIKRLDYLGFEW